MMETSTPQSDASIRLLDRAGHVLNDQPERVREDTDVPPNEDKTALISATLPDLSNVGAVQLVLSGHVVDSITVPATPPSAPAVQVSRSGATLAVRWNQPRAEGGRTTYDVQVSHDAGRTWKTVAVGLSSTSATLTPEQLGPGAPSQVRVIANDGFNTSPPGLASISP